jgi:hypothetical protein
VDDLSGADAVFLDGLEDAAEAHHERESGGGEDEDPEDLAKNVSVESEYQVGPFVTVAVQSFQRAEHVSGQRVIIPGLAG